MKKIFSVLSALIISITMLSLTSYADEWKKVDNGYVYSYSDGTKAKNGWLTVDNKTYYIQKDGTRKTGWMKTTNGTKYYFDKNGVAAKNKQVKFKNGDSYYFLSNGKMAVDYCYKKGATFYYYGLDGKLQDTAKLKLDMDYSELYSVIDNTYNYYGGPESRVVYKEGKSKNIEYESMYCFQNNKLFTYGYAFDKSDVSLKKIRTYFTDKFDAKPTYTNSKTGECYWKFKSYYFNVYTSDDYCYAVYYADSLVEKETAKTTAKSSTTTSQTKTIYITKTGKKYHYDGTCNGGTYYASTLAEAQRKGLTPCNKCVN